MRQGLKVPARLLAQPRQIGLSIRQRLEMHMNVGGGIELAGGHTGAAPISHGPSVN
jgi:hypothetical protein